MQGNLDPSILLSNPKEIEKAVKIDNESRIFIGRLGIEMAKLALREELAREIEENA